ncbi:SNF2 helicase associated domain-containing protein [Clostridium polynesiense]|uniref:SNF2 helicase associated domain-containing protein n=1 Tax=Clostridium polynesiense TaxID=1325933 RepID=UPI00058D23B0|nr:SNF2 helicase associated domain-containing protein [Clostridium polynesiense]
MIYDEKIIHNYAEKENLEKGKNLYNSGAVEDFVVQIYSTENTSINRYYIDTWVKSKESKSLYNVQISFNDSSGFTGFYCDCPYFNESYRRKGICPHISSVLIKFFNEKINLVTEERSTFQSVKLINKLDKMLLSSEVKKEKLNIKIHYYYFTSGRIKSHVEVKIGINRLYIVKDMEKFLECIDGGPPYNLSSTFTLDLDNQEFKEEDKKLIDLFKDIYEFNKINRLSSDYDRGRVKLLEGRKLFIPSRQVQNFFKAVSHMEIKTTINSTEIGEVYFYEEDLPLDFSVYKEEENIVVNPKGELPLSLDDENNIFYYKEGIYKPSKEQVKLYLILQEAMGNSEEPLFKIKSSEGEKYGSYMLPLLRNIGKNIEIDNEIKDAYIIEKLKAKAYIDKKGSKIKCSLIYSYGNEEIHVPEEDSSKDNSALILRDKFKEKNIERLISELNFKKEKQCFMLSGEEDIFYFLKNGVVKLQELCDIYYSEDFKTLKIYDHSNIQAKLSINKNNLLQIDFFIKDLNNKDIAALFKAIKNNKKYFKLSKGSFIDLENKELKKLVDFVENMGIEKPQLEEGTVMLPLYKAFAAQQITNLENITNVAMEEELAQALKEIKSFKGLETSVPEELEGVLREYQKLGYTWLKYIAYMKFGGILADEMGLGKTLQSIAFLLSEKHKGTSLIVAPTSLVYNWKEEIEKFAPSLKAVIINGTPEERAEQIMNLKNCDVIITSYGLLKKDIEIYREQSFYCFILDEAQNIKNPYSQNAVCAKEIISEVRFALTGTPIENSLLELWSLFDFIMPGYLLTYNGFISKFQGPISKNSQAEALNKLNSLIKPFILRRVKKDVALELPPKIHHKVYVDMTKEQKELYMAYLAAASSKIRKEINITGFEKNRIKILGALTRLRQICCDPRSFVENYQGESAKIQMLIELLQQAVEEKHKVLVFSQFTSVLKNIGAELKDIDIAFYYLDGSTSSEERINLVNRFNESHTTSIFLISLKAGGTGLNLNKADIVVHFDPWWNPAVEDQASDRAHRIGQKNTVEVIKLITKGTIEEKIYRLQEGKRRIISSVFQEEKRGGFIKSFTEKELLELIGI